MEQDRHRPTSEEKNYGDERYEQGYADGYLRCTLDARKRKILSEKKRKGRFGYAYDYLEDIVARRRKR